MKGIIIFTLLILFLTGCVAKDTSSTVSPNTPTPFRIETLVPTESMTLYKDDFTQMSGDWWEGETDYGSLAYESDGYHILGLKSEIMNWSILEKMTFSEGVLRLNYQQLTGEEKTTGVVIFWQLLDEENFYFLQILGNGYYSIAKYLDGEVVPIKSMKKSPFLYPETEENMVTIAFNEVSTDLFLTTNTKQVFKIPHLQTGGLD